TRRARDPRGAGPRPRCRGPHDDREGLGASQEAAAAAAAPVRPVGPPRPHLWREPLAVRLHARVPDGVVVRLPNWLGDTVMAVPAIRALRQDAPGGRLLVAGPWATLLGEQALADLLVERLGVAADLREPRLVPPDPASPARRRVRALLAEAGVDVPCGRARLVGVHLGAAYGSAKVWDPERAVELCRLLDARGDVAVLLGASSDVPVVETVRRASGAPSLAGRDGPDLLMALLAELDALACGDTG